MSSEEYKKIKYLIAPSYVKVILDTILMWATKQKLISGAHRKCV